MRRRPSLLAICSVLTGVALIPAAYLRVSAAGEMTAASAIGPDTAGRSGQDDSASGKARRTVIERSPNGMFYATVAVNGRPTRFLVDTGASTIVLARRDAAALGIELSETAASRSVQTVGGKAQVAIVKLDTVELAGRTLAGVEAAVVEEGVGAPLLGQSALAHLDLLTIRGDRMILN